MQYNLIYREPDISEPQAWLAAKLLQGDNKCQSDRLNDSAGSGEYNGDKAQCPAGMCRCSVCQTVGYIFKKHSII